jgi:hypothetical protein
VIHETGETTGAVEAEVEQGGSGDWPPVDRVAFWLLVAALLWVAVSPGLAALGGFGEWFLRADLLFGWLAFALVFIRARKATRPVALLVGAIIAFGLAELLTGVVTGAPIPAQAASFALYAFPLAVVATVLLAPPPGRKLLLLVGLVLAFAFIQFPILAVTAPFSTNPDFNRGTFIDLAVGFHLSGAVAGVGAIWLLGRMERVRSVLWSIPLLLSIFLTETRQVAALLPVVLGLSPALDLKRWVVRLIAPVMLVVLIAVAPPIEGIANTAGRSATGQVENAVTEPGTQRKVEGFVETAKALVESPTNLLFGLGQGNSVGFLALLGDDMIQGEDFGSSIGDKLGLEQSRVVAELGERVGYGSFTNEFSSLGGLVGDLGLIGSLAFFVGLGSIGWLLIQVRGRNRGAVQALGLFYLAMGLVYIWWEQPALTLCIALLMGAGLLTARTESGGKPESI